MQIFLALLASIFCYLGAIEPPWRLAQLIQLLEKNSKRITDAFNILGVMVVGALAANTIVLKTVAKIPLGGKFQPLQTVLDGIFPGLLPLAMVILGWWLVSSKQLTATKVIIIMVVIVTIGCLLGLF